MRIITLNFLGPEKFKVKVQKTTRPTKKKKKKKHFKLKSPV